MADNMPPVSKDPNPEFGADLFSDIKKVDSTKDIPVALHFPTIDINHSFEDLLTNSTSSSTATIRMARPSNDGPGLDESWASLDVSDYSQDEELQSVNADSESLVDLSSTHDTDSVADEEVQSEKAEEVEEEDQAASMVTIEPADVPEHIEAHQEQSIQEEDEDDTIILPESQVQPSDDTIDLEFNGPGPRNTSRRITMTVSKSPLRIQGQPLRIAYYGLGVTYPAKEELLGKVGAALLAPSSTDTRTFSILPTEFGASAKPTFAHLIPSQAQMVVDEITPFEADEVDLLNRGEIGAKINGRAYCSQKRQPFTSGAGTTFQPDIMIVQIGEQIETTLSQARDLTGFVQLAQRHSWPTIIVMDCDRIGKWDILSSLNLAVSTTFSNGMIIVGDPIPLDTFLRLDTMQLNKHLAHLDGKKTSHKFWDPITQYPIDLYQDFKQTLKPDSVAPRFELVVCSPDRKQAPSKPQSTLLKAVKTYVPDVNYRECGKQLLVSMVIMMLYGCILSASHALFGESGSLSWEALKSTSSVSASSIPMVSVPVVAPTSPTSSLLPVSVPTTTSSDPSAIPSTVPRIEQDMVIYDPIRFDQLWERLTGGPSAAPAPEPEIVKPIEDPKPTQSDSISTSSSIADKITSWTALIGDFHAHVQQRIKTKKEMRAQIKELHQKLAAFSDDVHHSVDDVSKHTQVYLKHLVKRSQKHLRRAHFAGLQSLSDILVEQKRILGKAQRQAQILTKEMPAPERKLSQKLKKIAGLLGKRDREEVVHTCF